MIINLKYLFFSIIFSNLFGLVGNLLGNAAMGFDTIIKPSFNPPAILFPIVWFILYTLMGVSSYIIYTSKSDKKDTALKVYIIQLIINALWPLFFFNLKWYLFSFLWIIIMLVFVIIMSIRFYKINKTAAYLQIPYIIWLIFAGVLNFNIFLLNK